jgi:hypothetical protein
LLENQNLSIVKYLHVTELKISESYKDYHEQFVLDIRMCVRNNVRVVRDYRLVISHNYEDLKPKERFRFDMNVTTVT